MNDSPTRKIHPEFQRHIDRQPYSVELDGLRLHVAKDVFPPDMGKCAQNLASICRQYTPRTALDMGCGTAYLAISLKKSGVANVWASDVHPAAVACAQDNVRRNSQFGPIRVVQSDLFDAIPAEVKFDLVVFNQPFGPGQGEAVCGCGEDGGYQITKRFLLAARDRLSDDGLVIMAFSDREPAENSPQAVADELGMPVRTLLNAYYGSAHNFIFEIRPLQSVDGCRDD